jgi:hypothetical protein
MYNKLSGQNCWSWMDDLDHTSWLWMEQTQLAMDGPHQSALDGPDQLAMNGPYQLVMDGPHWLVMNGPYQLAIDGLHQLAVDRPDPLVMEDVEYGFTPRFLKIDHALAPVAEG